MRAQDQPRRTRRLAIMAVCIGILGVPAAPASAGEYLVHGCSVFSAANPGFGSFNANYQSWNECPTAGWRIMGTNGVVNRAYYPGEEGGWILYAPNGTGFSRASVFSREQRTRDSALLGFGTICFNRWDRCQVGGNGALLKEGGGGSPMLGVSNAGAGDWSGWRDYSWESGFGPRGDALKVGIVCFAWGRPNCNTDHNDWTNTQFTGVSLTVADDHVPGAPTVGGSLVGEGWRRGTLDLSGAVSDVGGGVRRTQYRLGGSAVSGETRHPCADLNESMFWHVQPCPVSAGYSFSVPTNGLVPDGERQLEVWTTDAAGGRGHSAVRTVRIDNASPAAPTGIAVEGGEEWRASNRFTVHWTNPTGQHAPITRAHYSLCKTGGGCVETGPRAGPGIASIENLALASPGDWHVRVHLEDAAGNADPSRASEVARLRYDNERPERVEFEPPDPDDPQRLRVAVADRLSGIAGGSIEMRAEGGPWRPLSTRLEGSHLVTRIDDSAVAPGFYDFRATAHDRAGNTRSSLDGPQSRQRIYLPLRLRTTVRLRATRARCKACRRQRVRARRGMVALGFGAQALVRGVVQTIDRVVIPNVPVTVLYRHRATDRPFREIGQAKADERGRFDFLLPRRPSGTYRFRYAGAERFGPGVAELRTLVRASIAFRASRTAARNGQTVVFSGRLRGRPLPRGGRTVDVQAFVPGTGWRTFATPRTDRKGRFRVPYRFRFTSGVQRYRLRALLESSGDYPYERAASRPVLVTVRGP